jgi:hypothetical protein
MKSAFAHEFARTRIVQCQKVVSFFRASLLAWGQLKEAAEPYKGVGVPQSANQTRMTSVHMCVQSILKLRPVFESLLQTAGGTIRDDVVTILEDDDFWAETSALEKILNLFSKVIMAIQGRDSSLADVTRYMLFLQVKLGSILQSRLLPTGNAYTYSAAMLFNCQVRITFLCIVI